MTWRWTLLYLPPDPDLPIYESVRLGEEEARIDAAARKTAQDAGYAMGKGIRRFALAMSAFAEGLSKAQAEALEVSDDESDDA
jgi:hypothetical protein